jgi:hypothetical protein
MESPINSFQELKDSHEIPQMSFDPQKFEMLGAFDAANYVLALVNEGLAEEEVLPYFQEKPASMDMAHLELAVGMLGKVGSNAACQIVANYLDHPDSNVRFVATKTIASMTDVDERIMKQVVASLSNPRDDPMSAALTRELKVVLNRPANDEARRIAVAYLSKQ